MSEKSMEERVARAIAGANYPGASESDIDEMWEGFSLEAEAAIKAMREPTDAMLDAASIAYYRKSNDMYSLAPTEEPDAGGGPFGYAFRAAIDAALVGEG